MQESNLIMDCQCGKIIKKSKKDLFFVCNKCSSYYNKDKQLLVSRHNWNTRDFFDNSCKTQ